MMVTTNDGVGVNTDVSEEYSLHPVPSKGPNDPLVGESVDCSSADKKQNWSAIR
jgi:hypothetical protein